MKERKKMHENVILSQWWDDKAGIIQWRHLQENLSQA